MNVGHPMGVFHSFCIKNICYDKMDLRLSYFNVTTWKVRNLNLFLFIEVFTKVYFINIIHQLDNKINFQFV